MGGGGGLWFSSNFFPSKAIKADQGGSSQWRIQDLMEEGGGGREKLNSHKQGRSLGGLS